MSQTKRNRTGQRSAVKDAGLKAANIFHKGRWTGFIIASVVIALILIMVVPFYYQSYLAPFRRTIITVDNIPIRMDYFLKRSKLAGIDPMTMLEGLTNEQLIKLEAPQYVGEVTPGDINEELRRIALGESENISESEFREWYRQRRNESGLSDSEYKEITRTSLLASRLHEYLAERVPKVAEQVHLHAIVMEKYEDAQKVRARWQAGGDFAKLANEVSIDTQSKEKGGDLGWLPRGILLAWFDEVAFNLSTDNVSDPMPFSQSSTDSSGNEQTTTTYFLLKVSEKANARELDNDSLQTLQGRALNDWLVQERSSHVISYNYNSEIDAWVRWQLAKTTPSSGG